MTRRTLVLVLLLLAVSACVDQRRPEGCGEPSVEVELRLTADVLDPSDPAVCRDQEVTLVVASDVDGTIHVHGYDEHLPASEVTAGEDLRLEFVAERSGQFPIELHPAEDPQGIEVGILTVHEP